MNQQEHKAEAERLIELVAKIESDAEGAVLETHTAASILRGMDRAIATAQVHATLATVPVERLPFT